MFEALSSTPRLGNMGQRPTDQFGTMGPSGSRRSVKHCAKRCINPRPRFTCLDSARRLRRNRPAIELRHHRTPPDGFKL